MPTTLPELDVRMHWHARLDADPAQRWLRDTIREALEQELVVDLGRPRHLLHEDGIEIAMRISPAVDEAPA